MERLEIIKSRNFGDKFNELTSFIYDNFGVLWKWAFAFVTPCAMLMTALIKYMPDQTAVNILKMLICVLIVTVLSTILNTIVKHYFDEGIELRGLPIKSYISEILKNIGIGVMASLLFSLIVTLVAFAILGVFNVEGDLIIFCILFYCIIVALFSVPIFYSINAVIIEDMTAGNAIKRAIKLMLYRPFKSILFLCTMTVVGMLLPSIASIPFILIINVNDLFNPNGFFLFSIESKPIWEYISLTISLFCFTLAILAMGIGMMLEYGTAVEKADNVSFMNKYNNFENL